MGRPACHGVYLSLSRASRLGIINAEGLAHERARVLLGRFKLVVQRRARFAERAQAAASPWRFSLGYKAFIAYSPSDSQVAQALRSGLRAFVSPFWNRRGDIYLSPADSVVSQVLWSPTSVALSNSEYFILVASPAAAKSAWVTRQVDQWLARDEAASDRLVIVLADGEIAWDSQRGDFDWERTTALPANLSRVFNEEPRYTDLRWAKTSDDLTPRNPMFMQAVAVASAALTGRVQGLTPGDAPLPRSGMVNLFAWVARVVRELFRRDEVDAARPPHMEVEKVLLGASAPWAIKPGDEFTARFVAYIKVFEEAVKLQFAQLGPGSRSVTGLGASRWQSGTRVKVALEGNNLLISSPEQEFIWEGESNLIEFDVKVPPDAPDCLTVLKFEVSISEIVVAKLRLDLEINSMADTRKEQTVQVEPARTAFASYASKDRSRVLDRVSEVRRNGVDIFLDCLSLHPGDEWKPVLEKEIKNRDLFLLFWSVHAKQSEWVRWEWNVALKHKGLSGIAPHPLDPTFEAEPPPELSGLHFGDPYMLIRKALDSSTP